MTKIGFILRGPDTDKPKRRAKVAVIYYGATITFQATDPDNADAFIGEVTFEVAGDELNAIVKDSEHPDDGDTFLLNDYSATPDELN